MNVYYLIFFVLVSAAYAAVPIYENDFDDPASTYGTVTGVVSGGTATGGGITGGTTDGQGLNNYDEFSGDFWRVTAADDKLIIQVSNINPSEILSVNFSLAMLDSWDGGSTTYGSDILNMEIYDGGLISGNDVIGGSSLAGFSHTYSNVSNFESNVSYVDEVVVDGVQLGFNQNDPWWNEDAVTMNVENLQASSGTLTFVIWASSGGSGSGFQGGDDESFGIDNFTITSNVPEPSTILFLSMFTMSFIFRRCRRG